MAQSYLRNQLASGSRRGPGGDPGVSGPHRKLEKPRSQGQKVTMHREGDQVTEGKTYGIQPSTLEGRSPFLIASV